MKKMILRLLGCAVAGMVVLGISACGGQSSTASTSASPQPKAEAGAYVPNPTGKPMSEDLKDVLETKHKEEAKSVPLIKELPAGSNKDKKVIIAYFTWGGRSGEIAQMIHQKVGGDIYEIVRDPDYPADYDSILDVAAKEVDENARPKIAGEMPDLSKYDVIILGYPAWWFTAPMIIPSFLEKQHLDGKLIVPYMCSFTNPIEVSLPAIAHAAPGAKIFQGLTLDKDTDYNVIDPWLQKAGF